jgi:hypothetical protein
MLSKLLSAAWLFVALPDCLSDCLPDALPTPALVRATAGQSFVPVGGDARSDPPQSAGVGSAAGRWETRTVNCGPFGQQRSSGRFTKTIEVWVDDPPLTARASDWSVGSPAESLSTPAATKPATPFCPGGVCPGHR